MNQSVKKHLLQAPIVNGDSFYKVFAKNLLWYSWKLFSVEEWRGYAVSFSLSVFRLKRPFSPIFFEANNILFSLWNAFLPHQFFNAFSVIQFKYEFFFGLCFSNCQSEYRNIWAVLLLNTNSHILFPANNYLFKVNK